MAVVEWFNPRCSTHRGHLAGDEVAVLGQHVGHHEFWVGVRVDEPIVLQRVAEVACRVVLHQVKKRGLGVVWGSDGGDLVVLVPISTARTATSSSSPAAAATLTCVALRTRREQREKKEVMDICRQH